MSLLFAHSVMLVTGFTGDCLSEVQCCDLTTVTLEFSSPEIFPYSMEEDQGPARFTAPLFTFISC